MLNQTTATGGTTMDVVTLFDRATCRAAEVMEAVGVEQLDRPTPCADWSVQDLIDHMVGSTDYLLAALSGRDPKSVTGASADDYRAGREAVLHGLAEPGALDRTCLAPLGFEWTVGQATAGTFMDNLIHTWDLASATRQDATLDPELVEACTELFLPDMPEQGRASGLVGPEVRVRADATPQQRLLGSMGRAA
jgi:uncharacterized protein (TIGR03086 family)